MSGTAEGGRRAAARTKELYGDDHHSRVGSIGGKKSSNGGFASQKVGKDGLTGIQRAKLLGSKGGGISKRKPQHFVWYKKHVYSKGQYLSIKEVAELKGIKYSTAYARFKRGTLV